ncbi:hypothetical protein K435DRAFT_695627, partial [Dendrothele bispora CBS 962.96]
LVTTPDLRIVDFAVGLPGSQHDASAWEETHLFKEHDKLLGKDEFVWADSAYPLRIWCQSPYKRPEKDLPENTEFNYHVSAVRIRSEHGVGYFKGRWSSLRGLRLRIDNRKSLQFASLWIIVCIILHNFALEHEDDIDHSSDVFFRRGNQIVHGEISDKEAEQIAHEMAGGTNVEEEGDEIGLLEGKLKREELKQLLFEYLGRTTSD